MVSTSEGVSVKSAPEGAGAASTTTVDDRSAELRTNYRRLAEKLEQTTDPAQVVVLECCLSELQQEIDELGG